MEKEVDGGNFKSQNQKDMPQKEKDNQFVTGEPSMVTTDEVYALLGEQMIRAKNWAKIALAWNNNYKKLKEQAMKLSTKGMELDNINKGLKDSNLKYISSNQMMDKRVTQLNNLLKEEEAKSIAIEKKYSEFDIGYKELQRESRIMEKCNIDLSNSNLGLELEVKGLKEKLKRRKTKKPKK